MFLIQSAGVVSFPERIFSRILSEYPETSFTLLSDDEVGKFPFLEKDKFQK